MSKFIKLICAFVITGIFALGGCSAGGGESERDIMVISRESGSGTRGAFEEILATAGDIHYDLIADKTNNVITAVTNNKWAIGYISLGSLNDAVKALSINGVTPTAESVSDNTYAIARPFLVVSKKNRQLSSIAQDFKLFLSSAQAQSIITQKGYVSSVQNPVTYTPQPGMSGTLSINGSTSVGPLMVSLAAKYIELNSAVSVSDISIEQTGSGTGITTAIAGNCDFGMSSRELKQTEETELTEMTLCMDGIAVIVNKENSINNIAIENLKKIYTGEVKRFSQI